MLQIASSGATNCHQQCFKRLTTMLQTYQRCYKQSVALLQTVSDGAANTQWQCYKEASDGASSRKWDATKV
jgi:hypothetical protein